MENGRLSFMDLLIQTLAEHEKALSEKIDELDTLLEELKLVERNLKRMTKRVIK